MLKGNKTYNIIWELLTNGMLNIYDPCDPTPTSAPVGGWGYSSRFLMNVIINGFFKIYIYFLASSCPKP
jgi:hypothetical protein